MFVEVVVEDSLARIFSREIFQSRSTLWELEPSSLNN